MPIISVPPVVALAFNIKPKPKPIKIPPKTQERRISSTKGTNPHHFVARSINIELRKNPKKVLKPNRGPNILIPTKINIILMIKVNIHLIICRY